MSALFVCIYYSIYSLSYVLLYLIRIYQVYAYIFILHSLYIIIYTNYPIYTVNAASSEHPVFGWGGPGGRVYQKAYVEFFVSPDNFNIVTNILNNHTNLTIYAINSKQQFISPYTNQIIENDSYLASGKSTSVTAVTWGVFPNKEILQPTVFDPATFKVHIYTYVVCTLYSMLYILCGISAIRQMIMLCIYFDSYM